MGIKQLIHDACFRNAFLKKLYCGGSYIKGKAVCFWNLVVPIMAYKMSHRKPVFLVFTPEHANLGDHAIAYAETKMFNRLGIDFCEITGLQLYSLRHYKFLKILDSATVFVNGGGNLGTLWPEIESMNCSLIEKLPNATICFFPNSIYYENTTEGKAELQRSIEIYNQHPRLFLYAREMRSFVLMKEAYQRVRFRPDMVLSLEPNLNTAKRTGCLICMRSDVEKTVSENDYNAICSMAAQHFEVVRFTNTVLDHNVSVSQREKALYEKFQEFAGAELVITDRLHGMIFCAITGTKCIALGGKSPKIKGCYDEIKQLGFIKLADCAEEVFSKYNEISTFQGNDKLTAIRSQMDILEHEVTNLIEYGFWND